MKTGRITKLKENEWIVESDGKKLKVDPSHISWLRMWGNDGMEFEFDEEDGYAKLNKLKHNPTKS